MRKASTNSNLPKGAPGKTGEDRADQGDFFSGANSHAFPSHPQTSFAWAEREQVKATTLKAYALHGAMFRKWAEGRTDPLEALAVKLDRPPSYASKLSEAINRREGRHLQIDHSIPLLKGSEAAAELWMHFWSEELGYEPPVKKRVVSDEEKERARARVLAELPAPLREMIERETAKVLGVRPEDVKL